MKQRLLPLLLLAGVACWPAHRAQAQDKPVLNSAPPGPPPTQPRPTTPQPAPAPASAPTSDPAPTTAPTPPAVPTPDAPSGLNFPNRTLPKLGADDDQAYKKKFIYTNFGLGFSSYNDVSQFNVSAAPALGFRLTKNLALGPGISYAYSSYSVPKGYALTANGDRSISTSSVGFKAFAQYIVYKEFFVHAEYEVTSAQLLSDDGRFYSKVTRTVTTPLAGLGYRSYISEDAAFDIVGLYNFDNTIYSLYPGFVLRFSFLFNIGK
ncbi:hypothetical protein IC235_13865 [Hymenobacter sp. BT664]|uniref:Outer membrane protein beta-barrel domain-containing protein n=1 Tax=Hymenobacter montanus TaxID=2771359 RepID=A0A927BF90_9BACT|nr:hypothetical protein [Hymenobacter montanus]MBD2768974.1 hypothetical protein [Hymenobacter montanus]